MAIRIGELKNTVRSMYKKGASEQEIEAVVNTYKEQLELLKSQEVPAKETTTAQPTSEEQPSTDFDSMSFNKAFAEAKKLGMEKFEWKGNSYNTELAKPSKEETTTEATPTSETTTEETTTEETTEDPEVNKSKVDLKKSHITLEDLTQKADTSLMDKLGGDVAEKEIKTGRLQQFDKESQMIANLQKHYEGEDVEFTLQDEWGWNDKIIAKGPGGEFVFDTDDKMYKNHPEKYMAQFHKWMQENRRISLKPKLTNKQIQEASDEIVKATETGTVSEFSDPKIKELEKTVETKGLATKEGAAAQKELDKYKKQKREDQFDVNIKNEKELADKYNTQLENYQKNKARRLLADGVEEGSPEWELAMEDNKKQFDENVFGLGNVAIVNQYQGSPEDKKAIEEGKTKYVARKNPNTGEYDKIYFEGKRSGGSNIRTKKEIVEAAIANLKKSTTKGYGLFGPGGEFENTYDWLPEEDEWKLLDGLDFEQIEEIAEMRLDGDPSLIRGFMKTGWDDSKKKAHIDAIRLKLHKQETIDIEKQYNKLLESSEDLSNEKKEIDSGRVDLDERVNTWKTTSLPRLEEIINQIETSPNLTEKQYQSLVNEYDNLVKQGEQLQVDSDAYNKKLNEYNSSAEAINDRLASTNKKAGDVRAKYSFAIVDGAFKDVSTNFKNIKIYEQWRKDNKITKNFFDKDSWAALGQGLINTGAKYFSGTALWAINGINAHTGGALDVGGKERFSRLDAVNSMYERYTNYDYFGKARTEDYDPGEMNAFDKGALAIAEGLPFMLAIAASSGKEAFKPSAWTSVGKFLTGSKDALEFTNKIRAAKTAFHLTSMDNMIEGKNMGLNDLQSFYYGGALGAITGGVQMIMPDAEFFKAGAVNKVLKDGFINSLKQFTTKEGYSFAAKRWTTNVLKEIVEEEAEMILSDVAKASFGLSHSVESLEIDNHLKLIHDTAWLSGGMGAVGARADIKNIKNKVHNQLKGDISGHLQTLDYMSVEVNKKLQAAKKEGNVEAEKAYQFEFDRLQESRNYINNFKAALNVAPENITNEQLTDLTEKMRLESLKSKTDPAFHGDINEQIAAIDEKIKNSTIEQKAEETNKKLYKQTVETVKMLANQEGSSVQEFKADDNKTSAEKINDYINQKDENGNFVFDKKTRDQIQDGDFYGSFVTDNKGNKILLVNEEGSQVGEGVNVAAHEFLHQMLEKTYAKKDKDGNIIRDENGDIVVDKKKAIGIGLELANWITEVQGQDFVSSEMNRRLTLAYGEADADVQYQEVLTTLSDAIVSGDMVFEENAFTKLGDALRRTFQKIGLKGIKFNTGKDVFNFIKDYNNTIRKGQKLSKAQLAVVREGAEVGGVIAETIKGEDVADIQQAETKAKKLKILKERGIDPESEQGKTLLMSKPSNVAALLDKFGGNKRKMLQETLSKTKQGKDVFELKDNKGQYVNNPLVLSEFGQEIAPITETIAKRLFDPIPVNLRSGVTRGQFINDLTAIASSLVENEYDAAKQSIDKFISSRLNLRANKLASDLGIESTAKEGGLGTVVSLDKAAELTAEESGPITEDTPGIVLLKRIATSDQVKAITNSIKKKLPKLDTKKFTFKNLKDLTPEVTGEMFGISPKKLISGANLTKGELQSAQMFINKNADILLAMLPEGATVSGTSTGVPNTLLKEFYTKSGRAKLAKTGTKAGLAIQIKKENISKTDFLKVFGIIDGKPIRTDRNTSARVLALANQTGKMITNQTVRQQLMKDGDSNNNVLAQLEDGKSKVLFSKKITPSSIIKLNGKNEALLENRKLGEVIPESELSYDDIVKQQGLIPIKPSTKDGKKEFIQHMYNPLFTPLLPESFYRHAGSFSGVSEGFAKAGERALDYSQGIIQEVRIPTRNFPFRNEFEVNYHVDQAMKQDGFTGFADPDPDIEAAMSRVSYGDLKKKLTTKQFKERMKSKKRGLKKIWKAFEKMVETDRETAIPFIAALLSSTSATQSHFMRVSSIIGFNNELTQELRNELSLKMYGKKYNSLKAEQKKIIRESHLDTEEHASPISKFNKYLLNRLVQGNLFTDKKYFDKAIESLIQGPLPKHYDDALKGEGYNYKDSIDPEHEYDVFMGTKPVWVRYINDNVNNNGRDIKLGIVGGIDPNLIRLTNGNTLAQEYGVDAGKNPSASTIMKQQDLLADLFTLKKTEAEVKQEMKQFLNSPVSNSYEGIRVINNAIQEGRGSMMSKPAKGISVLDFDDTLATTKSKVITIAPDGTRGFLNAEQYAAGFTELQAQGYTFDFSEFSKVVEGKIAPLFKKALKLQGKFGPNNMFVLTARPANSALAIHEFLKANGLNIPLKNITGLANSTAEAKALWIADKVADGYNDFYFADDALQNVQAVKNMLDQFDVKSKVQQAKVKFSKKASVVMNQVIEDSFGIPAYKKFSPAKGKLRGKQKGRFNIFIPPGAEDFKGLMYGLLSKGKKGEQQLEFFNETLMKPFARASQEVDLARVAIMTDYKQLRKSMPDTHKKLNDKIPGTEYTFDNGVRIYLWNKAGLKVPGLTKTDQDKILQEINKNPDIKDYADKLSIISQAKDGWTKPGDYWLTESIASDMTEIINKVKRGDALKEFKENREQIFGKWEGGKLVGPNMAKLEAAKGPAYVEALTDILWRMENGTNRNFGSDSTTNKFTNWVNGSIGAIMFFNQRSAMLQLISSLNYVNYDDNNPVAAAKAFANQKQYWKDFAYLWNSPTLVARRAGLRGNIETSEIALAAEKGGPKGVFSYMLKLGFTPTQIADSFAICSGGAAMYRNRVNKYLKDGLTQKEAETKAFEDFNEITQENQQSSRADKISQQQAGPLGRFVLAFQNTPMQYTRLMKRDIQDFIAGRRMPGKTLLESNKIRLARIAYYGAIQNFIFGALQSALFRFMFDEDDEEKQKKEVRIANGMMDTLLRGMGVGGAVVSTFKNMVMKFIQQENSKTFDESAVVMEFLNLSPPIGSKARKIVSAMKTLRYQRDEIEHMSKLNVNNPIWQVIGNVTSGITNIPLDRVINKLINIKEALDSDNAAWQRISLLNGWNTWDLGVTPDDLEKAREEVDVIKEAKKEAKKEATKIRKEEAEKEKRRQGKFDYLTDEEVALNEKKFELTKLNKSEQVNKLMDLGLSSKQIKALKYEEDRVNKIIELTKKQ